VKVFQKSISPRSLRTLFPAQNIGGQDQQIIPGVFLFSLQKEGFMSRMHQRLRLIPRLEFLEDRCCPSSASITIAQGVIAIVGDGRADTITVQDSGKGSVSAAITSATGQVLATGKGNSLNTIKINGEGGNVTINYALTGMLTTPETLNLSLGGGNVKASLDFSAGINNTLNLNVDEKGSGTSSVSTVFGNLEASAKLALMDCLDAGSTTATTTFKGTETAGTTISIEADGNGTNQLHTCFGDVTGATISLEEHLGTSSTSSTVTFESLSGATVNSDIDGGKGNHTITCNYGEIGCGSMVESDACLGSATDSYTLYLTGSISGYSHATFDLATATSIATLQVNAAGNIAAGSSLALVLGGTSGAKNMSVAYAGQVNGSLSVQSGTGTGLSTLTDNITINKGSTGTVVAKENGGPAADSLTLNVINNAVATLSSLDAEIHAYSSDKVTDTSNVKVIMEK